MRVPSGAILAWMRRPWLILSCPVLVALGVLAACGEDASSIPDPDGADGSTGDAGTADGSTSDRDGSATVDAPPPIDAGHDVATDDGGEDAGLDASTKGPVMLFDAPAVGAVGRRLFVKGTALFWQYDVGGKSFIARGETSGGPRVDIVESDELISPSDVRETVVWQTASGKLFTRSTAAAPEVPTPLANATSCNAVTSSTSHVFCRGKDATIVRWPKAGGAGVVIASLVPEGPDLVTDDTALFLTEDQGNVSRMSVNGFAGGGPPVAPPAGSYVVLAKNQASPRGLIVGVPGDGVVYWMTGPAASARIRGCSKTNGSNAATAGPALVGAAGFTQYSPRAGAFVELEDGGAASSVVLVRFTSQSQTQPFHTSAAGVADLASPSLPGTPIYWIDDLARVWTSPP